MRGEITPIGQRKEVVPTNAKTFALQWADERNLRIALRVACRIYAMWIIL